MEALQVASAPAEAAPSNDSQPAQDQKPSQTGAAKPPETPASRPSKVKLKAYDKEHEFDLDKDFDKFRTLAERGLGADEAFRSAADKEKKIAQVLELWKTDPWAVMEKMGIDPDTAAEQRLLKKLQYESLSPEAKRAYELDREKAKLQQELEDERAGRRKEKDERDKGEYETLKSNYAKQLDEELPKALERHGLGNDVYVLERVLTKLIAEQEATGKVPDLDLVVKNIGSTTHARLTDYVRNQSVDKVIELLGDGLVDQIRQYQLSKMSEGNPLRQRARTESTSQPTRERAQGTKKIRATTDDFFKNL